MAQPIKNPTAPPTFEAGGHTWQIKLTLGLLDDVQQQTAVDLVPEGDNVSAVTGLILNHRKLGAVLWALCGKQAAERELDKRGFLDILDAAALAKGWEATVAAIVFFIHSRNPKLAVAVEKLIEKEMEVVEAGAVEMLAAIESSEVNEALKETARRIGDEMRKGVVEQLASSATNSQA